MCLLEYYKLSRRTNSKATPASSLLQRPLEASCHALPSHQDQEWKSRESTERDHIQLTQTCTDPPTIALVGKETPGRGRDHGNQRECHSEAEKEKWSQRKWGKPWLSTFWGQTVYLCWHINLALQKSRTTFCVWPKINSPVLLVHVRVSQPCHCCHFRFRSRSWLCLCVWRLNLDGLKRTWLFVVPFPLLSDGEAIQTCCLVKKRLCMDKVCPFSHFPRDFQQDDYGDGVGGNISISRGRENMKTARELGHFYANFEHFWCTLLTLLRS